MGMMRRRRRRRVLVAGAAGAAAGAGIAHHYGKKTGEEEADQEEEQGSGQDEATQYAPAPPEGAGPSAADLDEIERLAQLHGSGALTDEEFSSAKAKLLA